MTLRKDCFVVASLLLAMTQSALLYAGNPLEYTVYLKKFELKNNTGQWITVIEPDRPVDLVEEEARISLFNTAGRVPDGNYINFRITISETVKVQGRDEIHVTKNDGSVELIGDAEGPEDLPSKITGFRENSLSCASEGSPGPMKVKFSLNSKAGRDDAITLTRKWDFPEPMEVRNGSFIYAIMVPRLEDSVRHAQKHFFKTSVPDHDAMFAWPIRQVEQVKLTVDEKSVEMGPDDILVEY